MATSVTKGGTQKLPKNCVADFHDQFQRFFSKGGGRSHSQTPLTMPMLYGPQDSFNTWVPKPQDVLKSEAPKWKTIS
jgi:hypothetical protein